MTMIFVALSGCGGSSFRNDAEQVCRQSSARIRSPAERNSSSQMTAYADQSVKSLAGSYRRLARLQPPSDSSTAYDLLLGDFQRAIATATQLQRAAGGKTKADRIASQALSQQLTKAIGRVRRDSASMQLASCA